MDVYYDPAKGETPPTVVAGKPPPDQTALVLKLQKKISDALVEAKKGQTAINATVIILEAP